MCCDMSGGVARELTTRPKAAPPGDRRRPPAAGQPRRAGSRFGSAHHTCKRGGMAEKTQEAAKVLVGHGTAELPAVHIDSYNVELRDSEGFIGDRASRRAFAALLDDWRERLAESGEDPFGKVESGEIKKKEL